MNGSHLPVFVYGTLRNGLGNYLSILNGNTLREEPAVLRDAEMRDGGGCPFVNLTGSGQVTGEVMHLNPDTIEDTMRRLDRLESYRGPNNPSNMYERVQVVVTHPDGSSTEAWTYVTGRGFAEWTDEMPVVESGDWLNRHADTSLATA